MFWVPFIISAGAFFIGLVLQKPWLILAGAGGAFASLVLATR